MAMNEPWRELRVGDRIRIVRLPMWYVIVFVVAAAALLLWPAAGWTQTGKSESFVTVQPAGQWLVTQFIGQQVTNNASEDVGDINDLLFDKSGQVSTVVIGVGGFLGIGEKNVAIAFGSLSITADANGKRVVGVPLSKDRLRSLHSSVVVARTKFERVPVDSVCHTATTLAGSR